MFESIDVNSKKRPLTAATQFKVIKSSEPNQSTTSLTLVIYASLLSILIERIGHVDGNSVELQTSLYTVYQTFPIHRNSLPYQCYDI